MLLKKMGANLMVIGKDIEFYMTNDRLNKLK